MNMPTVGSGEKKIQLNLSALLLILAGLFGVYVRVLPVVRAKFPLLDGGLFYTMIQDLEKNSFSVPIFTSFNHLNIPFVYPSLPLFLAASVHLVTRADLLEIIRWEPAFFAILTIPAFYLLARSLLGSNSKAALATLFFSLLPRSYEWIIMGGGITRAPGSLFLILMAWAAFRAFNDRKWDGVLLGALFGGLVILSHPERALHAAGTGLLFWLWFDRSGKGTIRMIIIGIGALMISSPWWAGVLFNQGIEPLLLATRAAGTRWLFWAPLLQLNFTDETIPIIALFSVIGGFTCWKNKKGFLAIWFILAFLLDPRSAPHVVSIQASMLAAIAISDLLIPTIFTLEQNQETVQGTRVHRLLFIYLIILVIFNAQMNLGVLNQMVLTKTDREAIQWVEEKTPDDSRFLVLDWQESPMLSPLLEWFPALSDRTSIVTIQGREWLQGEAHYNVYMEGYSGIHECLYLTENCVETWIRQHDEEFNYLYLSQVTPNGEIRVSRLADSLEESSRYQVVYESTGVLIFERLP